jgi:ketosteroid isomerase-like protein
VEQEALEMRTLFVMLVTAACFAALPLPGQAKPSGQDEANVVATVQKVVDAFNKGDVAMFKALIDSDASVIDDMPPFLWRGRGAVNAWLAAVAKDEARMKDTDGHSVLGPPTYIRVDGNQAYAVFPDQFSYKRAGVPISEDGTATFALRKTGTGWKIKGFSYSAAAH